MGLSWESAEVGKLAGDFARAGVRTVRDGQKLVRDSAQQLASDGKDRAPKRTGRLSRSIDYDMVGLLEAEVGPTVFYAHYPEFGTSKMAPEPYMGPATDAFEGPFAGTCEKLGADILEGG